MLVKTPEDNLVIFGEHDDATLVQIKTCTATGEYGVLCADGHKGYAQPIGGVVAYKNKISISGWVEKAKRDPTATPSRRELYRRPRDEAACSACAAA